MFGILLIISALLQCLRTPYHSIIIAAGHFKETKYAAYGEALINITLSIALVIKFGLTGVTIGTVSAVLFRFVFYVYYLSKHIFYRSVGLFIKRTVINVANFSAIVVSGRIIVTMFRITDYFQWLMAGICVGAVSCVITFLFNLFFYKSDFDFVTKCFRRQRAACIEESEECCKEST